MERIVVEHNGRFFVAYVDVVDDFGRDDTHPAFDSSHTTTRATFYLDSRGFDTRLEAERSARGDCHICGKSGGH